MFRRFFLSSLLTAFVACGGSQNEAPKRDPNQPIVIGYSPSSDESVESAPAPTEAPAMPPSQDKPAPTSSLPAGPTPYPNEWIRDARSDNSSLACMELVYKNGCSQTRTGTVIFEVTIDEKGVVEKFSEIDNQIAVDKKLVSQCLAKKLPQWTFHPPEDHLRTFQVSVTLADKC